MLQIHAYCLMSNHFHLVLETPRGNLVTGMKWHLSVHLNPARARLLKPKAPLSTFPWSSYPAYLQPKRRRPPWLRTDRLLGEFQLRADTHATRLRLRESMEKWRAHEDEREYQPFRRGWFAGLQEEKERLLETIQTRKSPAHYGDELRESDQQRAERLVKAQLAKHRWTEKDLPSRPKGHKIKLQIAQHLRAHSSATIPWIAERLHMGAATHLSHLLYWARRGNKPSQKAPPRPRKPTRLKKRT